MAESARSLSRSFQFCEPKFEVEIVGPTHLSRDKKIPKKIQGKNVTDPSDDESCQDRPNVFMAMNVCSYQAPAFRASNSPAARTVSRSPTDSLTTVGAVVGGEFYAIAAGDVGTLEPATLLGFAGLAW
jgi:hypothetical protein